MYHEIMEEQQKLDVALKQLNKRGKDFAEAQRDYYIARASAIMNLRAEGKPVTLVLPLVKGIREVADLEMKRIIAETMYKSTLEAINVLKLKIRIMENQYDKEWGNTK
jgi:hypothetical protein